MIPDVLFWVGPLRDVLILVPDALQMVELHGIICDM